MAQDVPGCGALNNAFGPFDYRTERRFTSTGAEIGSPNLKIVEDNHFTAEVEGLMRGKSGPLGGDINYTLRAFPNHHRALLAMAALGVKEKTPQPKGSFYTVECWFRRAVAWKQDDNVARMLFARWLVQQARAKEAEDELKYVADHAQGNALTLQNIGLIYFDMKNFDQALNYAHKAYAEGLVTPTLKDQLKQAGKWVEPPEPAQPTAEKAQ
jgi:tetratricopeptide (TPR) repeat protein